MRTLGTILTVLLVSSSAAAIESSQSADAIYTAEQAVTARLHTRYAADFRNVTVYRPDASERTLQAVCGEVHARSGYDLYGGFRVFVWLPNSESDRGTAFIGSEANGVLYLCRNAVRQSSSGL